MRHQFTASAKNNPALSETDNGTEAVSTSGMARNFNGDVEVTGDLSKSGRPLKEDEFKQGINSSSHQLTA